MILLRFYIDLRMEVFCFWILTIRAVTKVLWKIYVLFLNFYLFKLACLFWKLQPLTILRLFRLWIGHIFFHLSGRGLIPSVARITIVNFFPSRVGSGGRSGRRLLNDLRAVDAPSRPWWVFLCLNLDFELIFWFFFGSFNIEILKFSFHEFYTGIRGLISVIYELQANMLSEQNIALVACNKLPYAFATIFYFW